MTFFKRLRGLAAGLLPAALLFLLLSYPAASMDGVRRGLRLFGDGVLPALLPFFVVCGLLGSSGLFERLSPLGRLLGAPFGLRPACGGALPLCLLTGAPSGARLAADLCKRGQATPDEAARLLAAGTVTGPLFLLGSVGAWLGSPALGAFVYLMQLLCAFLNGLLWRRYGGRASAPPAPAGKTRAVPLPQALPEALSGACSSLLLICGTVCFFSALASLLEACGFLTALEQTLSGLLPAEAVRPLLLGTLELTAGCEGAAGAALTLPLRLSLLCALSSFGGLSVLLQSACFLQGLIPLRICFLQRLSHAALSFCLCRLLSPFLLDALPAWASLLPISPPSLAAYAYAGLFLCAGLAALLRAKRRASTRASS